MAEKMLFWRSSLHFKICKIHGGKCISCLWPLLGNSVSHYLPYRLHFKWHFHILAFEFAISLRETLPAFGEKHNFESYLHAKPWIKPLSPSKLTKKCTLGNTCCISTFAKSNGKICISYSWAFLGSYIHHYFFIECILNDLFAFWPLILSSFCEKALPASSTHIAQIRKESNTCMICRMYFSMLSSSCSPRFCIAVCRSKNIMAAVLPSPEGLQ